MSTTVNPPHRPPFEIARSSPVDWLSHSAETKVDSRPSEFVARCESIAQQIPSAAESRDWVRLAQRNDFVVVRQALEPEWLDHPQRDSVADQLLGVLSTLLGGCHRLSDKADQGIIHNVRFDPKHADTQLGAGCQELDWHVEDGCHGELRPSWLLILCLVEGPSVETHVSRLQDFRFPEGLRQQLFDVPLELRLDESFDDNNQDTFMVPVLKSGRLGDEIVYDPAFTSSNEETIHLIAAVRAQAVEHAHTFTLNAGDLLVLNNRNCVHARSGFNPSGIDRSRFVKRALAC